MFPKRACDIAASAILSVSATMALAHVTLEAPSASVGSTYKAVMRVGHGCGGSPTLKIRVQIPEGVVAVEPMPKPGWKMDTIEGPYKRPYDDNGTPVTQGVREIVWTGKLPDRHHDEFVFQAYLTDSLKPDTILYFPVVQECEKGVERWIEIPTEGRNADDYKSPAPGVKLRPKAVD